MKCDKLNAYKGDVTIPVYGTIADAEVYLKKDVNEAISELKHKLQDHCISCPVKEQEDDVVAEKDKEIAELKAKLENVERKCRAKMEEYR